MNDELREMNEAIFNRIVLGVGLIGLILGLVFLIGDSPASPWFIRAVALLIFALVAVVIRQTGRIVVASYVLVLELTGLVFQMFLHPGAITGFIPYLFIPIVMIAGLLLTPLATFVMTLSLIVAVLLIAAFTGQLTLTTPGGLWPPLSLILLAALMIIEGKRHIIKLGDYLLENRALLKERTLETMEILRRVDELKERITELEKQLTQASTETRQTHLLAARRDDQRYELIKGIIQELDASVKGLEHKIEQIGELPNLGGHQTGLLEAAWQKLYYLKSLTINLEEIAQVDHGKIRLSYHPIDVGRLIGEVVGTARGLAREKNLEVRYQVPEDLPPLQADPVRLRQALLHVLNNAVKYTDQGIIEIQAELNEHELMIFISDTGIGMHREEFDLVFQEFGCGSGTLAQRRKGAGLGLAISKRLVELHGGRMWVTSVLGVGSTFYMALPLELAHDKVRSRLTTTGLAGVQPTVVSQSVPVPERLPAALPADETPTLVSAKVTPRPVGPFSEPIRRFRLTYTRRFGFILLSLLCTVAGIAAVLAAIYGPAEQETFATPSVIPSSSPASAANIAATATPTPTLSPTFTPSPTLQPTATATLRPTDPPSPTPTETPTEVPPSPTATATSSPTRTPTQEPSPTLLPPTATPTATAAAKDSLVVPVAIAQPGIPNPPPLFFITGQAGQQIITRFDFEANVRTDLTLVTTNNSRLSWSDTGQVLFVRDEDGDREIYLATADGGQPVRLNTAIGDDLQPAWSPDGDKIAFSSGRTGNFEIYVMDADGSNPLPLTSSRGFDEWPAWSPDGHKIAFVSDRDGNAEIYTMDIDGNNQRRMTNHPADDWPATWSPDGQQLVFASNRDDDWNLYVVEAGGGPALRLTNAPGAEREPSWSPDGQTIAFAYNGANNWDIYTLPAPTVGVTEVPPSEWSQITDTPTDERYPAWLE